MKLTHIFSIGVAVLMVGVAQASAQTAPAEAFDNVTIHTASGQVIESGTIVWRDGIISSVGKDVAIPFDAYVHDGGDSLHVYPGFIDGLALWGSPEDKGKDGQPEEPGDPSYKRAGIQPHRQPSDLLNAKDEALAKAPEHGFTTAALGLKGQMLPGQLDLFFINGPNTADNLLKEGVGAFAQFEEAEGATYPSTMMALMVQFRQLFYDAKAQRQQQEYFASVASDYPAPKKEEVLEALYPVMDQEQPFFFVVDSKENIERLFWLQDEFDFEVVLVSGKEAHEKADELKERNIPVLASIDLPEEPDWMSDDEEKEEPEEVTDEMRIFRDKQEQAYRASIENIQKLKEAGVEVGYASNGVKLSDIRENLTRLSEEGGLNNTQILNLLTQSTADILGFGQRLGDIKEGRVASFTVYDTPFMEEKAQSLYSVTNGTVTEIESESSK
ncbi:amidohydrolase family protein [Fodinibius salsisoli]|uniref:Amidohydrolase family protein n=1 Tax=Fodinibius salsisoli TaxID=2820877 RepID=A0ABT3PQT4_9BACT|nr:amidohydrolase family protein [Fodinibius salsisoli]MCW9708227.1 amidohydrolase family protein [Fodinibius salsisoli]